MKPADVSSASSERKGLLPGFAHHVPSAIQFEDNSRCLRRKGAYCVPWLLSCYKRTQVRVEGGTSRPDGN